jgi:hypothetical protein
MYEERNLKVCALILFGLLGFSQLVAYSYASGGSKVTTFHYGEFITTMFDIDVRFSWDNDLWRIKEPHEIGFSFEVRNINSYVVNLNLDLKEITVRLKSEKLYHTVGILSEDVSNMVTTLVWRQDSHTILNTIRSFSYTVQAPEPINSISEDTSVELYYLIELDGDYLYEEPNAQGSGYLSNSYLSNEGDMSGGVEDPLWITIKGEPSFPWLYIVMAIALVGSGATLLAWFLTRKRRTKNIA